MALRQLGRYEVVREIASGGMATVFLGRILGEGGFQRLVALKLMHAHIASEQEFVSMFLDEARLAARIRHPNVVPTIDIQRTAEGMFLVMEYVDGPALQTIRKYLRKQKQTLPIDVTLRVFLDLLAGLHAAHELSDEEGKPLQLVHRDVSPHNILIGTDGVARIVDFGVARAEERLSNTRSGQIKGKMAYMSPEQVLAETVDRRSDIYAAGVVLWEALTGKRLFKAQSEGALVHAIITGSHDWPHKVNKGVPLPIASVCMRALSQKPSDRFATAEQFAEALEDAATEVGLKPARAKRVGSFIGEINPLVADLIASQSGAYGAPPIHDSPAARVMPPFGPDESNPAINQTSEPSDVSVSAIIPGMIGGSGTNGAAVLNMPPRRRSRSGVIVLAVAATMAVVVVVALAVGLTAEDPPAPATRPPETSPAPAVIDETGSDETDETEPAETAADETAPDETAEDEANGDSGETAADAASASASAPSVKPPTQVVPPPPHRPRPRPFKPRPKPTQPKPAPTTFRPKRL